MSTELVVKLNGYRICKDYEFHKKIVSFPAYRYARSEWERKLTFIITTFIACDAMNITTLGISCKLLFQRGLSLFYEFQSKQSRYIGQNESILRRIKTTPEKKTFEVYLCVEETGLFYWGFNIITHCRIEHTLGPSLFLAHLCILSTKRCAYWFTFT